MGNAVQANSNVAAAGSLNGATLASSVTGSSLTSVGTLGSLAVTNNVTVGGNFTVSGTTTTVDSVTLSVKDKNIEMGVVSSPSDTTADGGGLTLKGASDKTFNWVNATDAWTSSEHIHLIDNKKLFVGGASGTTDGLEIVHNGSNSILNDSGTGTLQLQLGGSTKLEITSGGIDVTGAITVDGAALATAPTVTAVANGSIANNKTVKIDADGKVSEVKIQTTTLTPPTANTNGNTFSSGWGGSGALSATFVVSGTTYLWVLSAGTNVIKGRVDKLNATVSSWTQIGTSYTIQSWQTYYMSAIFNSNLNKAAIFYGEDSGGQDSYCRVLYPDTTTSPPTMGSGSAQGFTGYASNKSRHLRTVWDDGINSGNGRGIHAWLNCSSGSSQNWHLEYNTFTMANNNTFTFETSAGTNMNIFNTTNAVKAENWEMCGCGSGRFLVVARREDGGATDNQTWFRMGTINSSSNDITWGSTGSAFSSTIYYYHRICYDETSGKVIMLARASGDSQLLSFVGTISGTGSSLSISWGSGVQAYGSFSNMVGNNIPKYNMVYDPAQTKIMMLMPDTSGTTVMKTRVATISGTSVSWGTEQSVTFQGGGNNIILGNPTAVGGRVFLATDNGSTVYGTILKTSEDISSLTEPEQYIGFADQAYTNGQTATIKTYGNIVDTLSGLTPGTKYYLQGDGTVGTSSTFTTTDLGWNGQGVVRGGVAGVAISSSKLLIRHAI